MNQSHWQMPLALTVFAVAVLGAAWLEAPVALRAPLVFMYVLLGCGFGWVRLLNVARGVAEWMLAIVLSLSIAAITAIAMLYAGLWSPDSWLAFLALVGTAGAVGVAWHQPTAPEGTI